MGGMRNSPDDCFGPKQLAKCRCCYWLGKTGSAGEEVQGGGGDEEFGLGVLSGDVRRAGGCVSLQFRGETGHINVGDTSVWMTLRGLDHQRGEYRGIRKT